MAAPEDFGLRDRPHLSIDAFRETAAYTVPRRNLERKPLRDDYAAHAAALLQQLAAALGDLPAPGADPRISVAGLRAGAVVEITTVPPTEGARTKAVKVPAALEFQPQDVVLLRSTRNNDRTESALLFVPDDARAFLRGRIAAYGRDPGNARRPDVERFETVETVRAADVRALFTGEIELAAPEIQWWELWVREAGAIVERLVVAARDANLDVHPDRLVFPDTSVIFVHSSAGAVAAFASRVPGAISEIRRATGTIEPFLERGAPGLGAHEWVEELAARVTPPPEAAPAVCTLDTGVAAEHPLIAPGLRGAWACDAAWGSDDHHRDGGHGTPLAGLVLYGDLEPLMNGARPVTLTHAAESMKLLPPRGFPPAKPPAFGVVTQSAIALVETERPNVPRTFCLANSATDFPPDRPSSWSGALDQVAAGAMLGDAVDGVAASDRPKRLVLVATGNVSGGMMVDVMPSQPLEDPAQSWNAVTIGGFTRKEVPPAGPPDLEPVVPANHRSPFSRGSQSLPHDLTPIKPEVLFEAGNMVSDAAGFCGWDPAVSLLAPGSDTAAEPLIPFCATSAAVGVAGNFAGRLHAALPEFWPETLRALTVDSARWPEPIAKQLIGRGAHWKTGSKTEKQRILREVGYGVPDIERAISSTRNDVTLVAQAEIQPFALGEDRRTAVFNELHFYGLPWPRAALERIENGIVVMKVALSYFIEPNLTGKAATRPDTYRSFGLRFDVKKRTETVARFRNRISSSQAKDGSESAEEKSCWLIGPKAVQAGSLHCDLWRGRAIDLASHDAIAVYPVGGWWKSHVGQRRVTDKGRYALTVSISAPGQAVDLYTEIAAAIELKGVEAVIG
ncbi:S8 family peptidase [Methylobacterium sp. C25]|uniref:S8 family peptidase n=1 Tax=Methylobacterium sp. C25 TaxID=2721622 RepID=UPI001F2E39CF|nr:S8 family peptidase [Methylobacterium sp. C25]MCE4226760.1 S8 family peptidase [Methylobacterium sp. C25]